MCRDPDDSRDGASLMPVSMLVTGSALFICAALLASRRWRRERRGRLYASDAGEGRVGLAISSAGGRVKVDRVFIDLGGGKTASIDHVVLGTDRLVVIETKSWNGVICGRRRERDWVQVRPNGERIQIRNPIMQVKRQAKILAEAVGVPVAHLVVMAGRVTHQDGLFPEGVVPICGLKDVLKPMMTGPHPSGSAEPSDLQSAWDLVRANAGDPGMGERATRYGEENEARHGRREWIGWLAMAVASGGAAIMAMS